MKLHTSNRAVMAGIGLVFMAALGSSVFASEWETDFEKASKDAAKSGSYLLLDFSGSDWCGWCVRLEKEVFSKPEFKEFAKKNLVCVLLDFPRSKAQSKELKEQNTGLARKFEIRGYPTVLILAPDGSLVARTGYQQGGPAKYVQHLKGLIDEHKKKTPPAK